MSIPDWTYSEQYYAELLAPRGLEIRTDPVKGKGLFATRKIEQGDLVLEEHALCCTQNLDDVKLSIPVCATCLRSVEQPTDIVKRLASKKCSGKMPQKFARTNAPLVRCRHAGENAAACATVYCSKECEAKGWAVFHGAACTGIMTEDSKDALKTFMSQDWIQSGIDLSDTNWLGVKFVAIFVTRFRQGNMSLEDAWAPIGQLIRAPLEKFFFTYLVADDFEAELKKKSGDEAKPAKMRRRFLHFLKHKENQEEDPITTFANREGPSKAATLAKGKDLVQRIFAMTEPEATFFTVSRWSELLGAILLNGQERAPNSPFFEVREANKKAFTDFIAAMRAESVNHRDFDSSSRGQGVYTVGACFNHNCSPNIQVSYSPRNDETLFVTAMRDIEAGEELCISYIDEHATVEVRQQHLYEHYLFTCSCAKCQRDMSTFKKNVETKTQ